MNDVLVIVRWSDGALGLTGWGTFFLCLLVVALSARGSRS